MAQLEEASKDTPEQERPGAIAGAVDPPPVDSAEMSPAAIAPIVLTQRQIEVLRLVAAGLTNREVAAKLGLSVYTIETHLRLMYRKLKVTTRGAAIRYAFENSLAQA